MKDLFNDLVTFLIVTVGTILSTLLKDEALGLLSRFSRFLVERAVKRLPEGYRETRREEWLGALEFEGKDGKKVSELKAALDVWLGAGEMARALAPKPTVMRVDYEPVPVASPYFDSLTLLPSRYMFRERLDSAVFRAKCDPSRKVALIAIGVDDFKRVNNIFGHPRGDELLIDIARRLERCVGVNATIARYGGDEFVVLLEGPPYSEDAVKAADTALKHLSIPFEWQGTTHPLSVSVGVAVLVDHLDAENLLRRANLAMYRAKIAGKGCLRTFDQSEEEGR